MGRANKNTISHTDSRYYLAVDGNEKIQKRTLMGALAIDAASIMSITSVKNAYFPSISRLSYLDYSGKLLYCAETQIERGAQAGVFGAIAWAETYFDCRS